MDASGNAYSYAGTDAYAGMDSYAGTDASGNTYSYAGTDASGNTYSYAGTDASGNANINWLEHINENMSRIIQASDISDNINVNFEYSYVLPNNLRDASNNQ